MLSIEKITQVLANQLNSKGDLLFQLTRFQQQDYMDLSIVDADGQRFIAGVLSELPMPILTDFYQTRVRQFEIYLKGAEEDLNEVERIVNESLQFEYEDVKYNLANIVSGLSLENDGFDKIQVFKSTLRLTVNVPMFVTGNDIKTKIDGIDVGLVNVAGIFDKALISTKPFGDNMSAINTGLEMTMKFALGSNDKVNEIFGYVLDQKYNKTFTFEFDFIVSVFTVELVLRSGSIYTAANNNALTFDATFTKALARTEVTINNHKVSVVGFTAQMNIVPSPRNTTLESKIRAETFSKLFSFYLENDGSSLIDDLIDEFNEHNNKKFAIKFKVNNKEIEEDCIVQNITFTSSENPFAVINVTMGVGSFE